MIPAIAVMIAAYICTRMVEMLLNSPRIILKVLAVLTIIVVLIACVDVLEAGSRAPALRGLYP